MNIYDVLQLIGGIILVISYFPQIIKLLKTKDATGLSVPFFIVLIIGMSLMCINAFHIISLGVISYAITQVANILLAFIVLVLILYYNRSTKWGDRKLEGNLDDLKARIYKVFENPSKANIIDVTNIRRQCGKTTLLVNHWKSLKDKDKVFFIAERPQQERLLIDKGIPTDNIISNPIHNIKRDIRVMFDEGISRSTFDYLLGCNVDVELGFINTIYM